MIPPPACQGGARVGQRTDSYVYLLKSQTTGKFYIGWTTDLRRRLEDHAKGESTYTKSRGPWVLVGWERFRTSEEAKTRERSLKHHPRMLALFKKRLVNVVQTASGGPRRVVG